MGMTGKKGKKTEVKPGDRAAAIMFEMEKENGLSDKEAMKNAQARFENARKFLLEMVERWKKKGKK